MVHGTSAGTVNDVTGFLVVSSVYAGATGVYSIGYNRAYAIYEADSSFKPTVTMNGYNLTIASDNLSDYWIFKSTR